MSTPNREQPGRYSQLSTAREHDPALVATGKRVIDTHIFYVNACGCGWLTTGTRSERDDAYSEHLAAAVIDAVADDIARAERERITAEFQAKAGAPVAPGCPAASDRAFWTRAAHEVARLCEEPPEPVAPVTAAAVPDLLAALQKSVDRARTDRAARLRGGEGK